MDLEDIEAAANQNDENVKDVQDDFDDDFTEEQFVKAQSSSQQQILKDSDEDDEDDVPVVKSKKKPRVVSDDEDDSNQAESVGVEEDEEPMTIEEELEREQLAQEAEERQDNLRKEADVLRKDAKNILRSPISKTTIEIAPETPKKENEGDDLDDYCEIGKLKERYALDIHGDNNDDIRASSKVVKVVEAKTFIQPPFQPSSTPSKLSESFLKWNEVGIVRRYRATEEKDEETIDVEFHDKDVHHSILHNNTEGFSIAELSNEALILATRRSAGGVSSNLMCYNFNTWDDPNKEWKCQLPDDEYIDCMALGLGFIALATDKGFIRIFTIGGIQTYLFSIPGPVVSMAAQEQSLIICYHSGIGVRKSQNLSMYVLKIDHKTTNLPKQTMCNSVPVALSPSSTLSWIGFTDEGTPCTVDSDGLLRLYKYMIGNTWIPVVNLKENVNNKADNYWVIGLSEVQERIRCVFCKGAKYPSVTPRPQVGTVDFELPFCQRNTTKGKNEERHIRAKLSNMLLEKLVADGFNVENQCRQSMTNLVQSLLKIFAMAITSNCEALAYEVSRMMPPLGIESAIKYAKQRKCHALAEKMIEVAHEKMDEETAFLEAEEDEVYEAVPSSNSVVLAEIPEESMLRPKPLAFGKKRRQESGDEDIEILRPKNGQLPSRSNIRNNKYKVSESEDGFQAFYDDIRETLAEDNPELDEEQLLELAKEGFKALDVEEKTEWKSKKARVE